MHTLTLAIHDDSIYHKLMQTIQSIGKVDVLQDTKTTDKPAELLDFGAYQVTAFHNVDALDYQKAMRDEW